VHAHNAASPFDPGAPAGLRLVEKALHAAFGIGFPLVRSAGRGDLYEFVTWGRKGGVGEAVAGGVDPVIEVRDPEPAWAGVGGSRSRSEWCWFCGPGKASANKKSPPHWGSRQEP
jgi:hypothetical protein